MVTGTRSASECEDPKGPVCPLVIVLKRRTQVVSLRQVAGEVSEDENLHSRLQYPTSYRGREMEFEAVRSPSIGTSIEYST